MWPTVKYDGPLTQYRYQVNNLRDPKAPQIGNNHTGSYQRHLSLRRTYGKLPEDVQNEFNKRLSKGLASGYWKILSEDQVKKVKTGNQHAHWLPANFVLEEADSSATSKFRLILDPSGSLNKTLVPPPNTEEKTSM